MPAELAELAHSINDMLRRLDDAFQRLSAFSADIAHELRTPLNAVLGFVQAGGKGRAATLDSLANVIGGSAEGDEGLAELSRIDAALTSRDALTEWTAPHVEGALKSALLDGLGHATP